MIKYKRSLPNDNSLKDSKILLWNNQLLTYRMPILYMKVSLDENIKLYQDITIHYNHYEGVKGAWYLHE